MQTLDLAPIHRAHGDIVLPGSKSISNRCLLLAALADGVTIIRDLLDSDDTARMLEALKSLGVEMEQLAAHDWRITGCRGLWPVRISFWAMPERPSAP